MRDSTYFPDQATVFPQDLVVPLGKVSSRAAAFHRCAGHRLHSGRGAVLRPSPASPRSPARPLTRACQGGVGHPLQRASFSPLHLLEFLPFHLEVGGSLAVSVTQR